MPERGSKNSTPPSRTVSEGRGKVHFTRDGEDFSPIKVVFEKVKQTLPPRPEKGRQVNQLAYESISAGQKQLETAKIHCADCIAGILEMTSAGPCSYRDLALFHTTLTQHFGDRERHVQRCRVLGGLLDESILNYEVSTAHGFLEHVVLPYYEFLRSHVAPVLDVPVSALWPTDGAFGEVQYLIRCYQPEKSRELQKKFEALNLPVSGFMRRISPKKDYVASSLKYIPFVGKALLWLRKFPWIAAFVERHLHALT